MRIKALSVVKPFGSWIAEGSKTIEVRSWLPQLLPDEDLLIVENGRRLDSEGDQDSEGMAIAIVRVKHTRPFVPADMVASRATYFAEGYYSWELVLVRKIVTPFGALAARGIYEIELKEALLHS